MAEHAPGYEKHPNHRVAITPRQNRVRVLVDGQPIAESTSALLVEESRYPPVWYLPMVDVRSDVLQPTDHSTYCPFKGRASYWNLTVAGRLLENVVWGYPDPYLECLELANHVAFYADRVTIEVDGQPPTSGASSNST